MLFFRDNIDFYVVIKAKDTIIVKRILKMERQ